MMVFLRGSHLGAVVLLVLVRAQQALEVPQETVISPDPKPGPVDTGNVTERGGNKTAEGYPDIVQGESGGGERPGMENQTEAKATSGAKNYATIVCEETKKESDYWPSVDRRRQEKLCKNVKSGMRKKELNELRTLNIVMKPQTNWTCEDWKFIMTKGRTWQRPNVTQIPSECMNKIVNDKRFMGILRSTAGNVMTKLASRLKATMGKPSDWDASKLRSAKDFLGSMPIIDLEGLPENAIKDALADLKNIKFQRPSLKAAMGKKVIAALGGMANANKWSADDIINSEQFIRNSPRTMARLNADAFEQSVQSIGKKRIKRQDAVLYAKRLKRLPKFSDPKKLSSSALKTMGSLLGSMGNAYLKDIPGDVLMTNIEVLNTSDLSYAEKRIIIRKLQTVESFKITKIPDLQYLGSLVGGLKADDLEACNETAFKNITQFKSIKLSTSLKHVVVSKFKKCEEWTNVARTLGNLMKVLKPSELTSLSFNDLALGCKETAPLDMQVTDIQASILFDTVQAGMGDPNTAEYNGACFERWGCFARRAISRAFIDNLPQDERLLKVADTLADKDVNYMDACVMEPSMARHLASKLEKVMNLDEVIVSGLDNDKLLLLANFLPYISEKVWTYITPKKVTLMIPIIGLGGKGVPREVYIKLKDFALKSVYLEESDEVVDRTTEGDLDVNALKNMGFLRCFLTPDNMKRLTKEALEVHLTDMQTCPFSAAQGKALFDIYAKHYPDLMKSKTDITRGAGILQYASFAVLQAASQEALADSYADMLQCLAEKYRVCRCRDKEGFRDEMSNDERRANAEMEFRMLRQFITAVAAQEAIAMIENEETADTNSTEESTNSTADNITESENATEAPKQIGKRDTEEYAEKITCSDIQQAGGAARAIGADLLKTLSVEDFNDCAEELGEINTWSKEQLTELVNLAKKAWGDSYSAWSVDKLLDAANILAGMPPEDLLQLNVTDINILSAISESELFDSKQMEVLFTEWLRITKNISALTAKEIVQIGNIVCGMTTELIDALPVDVYKESTVTWGSIPTCDESRLRCIGQKALDAFGSNPSNWTVTTLRQIGASVVLTSKDVLKNIPISLLVEIPPTHMKLMPPDYYKVLSVEQLTSLTDYQKAARSPEQFDALSAEQKAVFVKPEIKEDLGGKEESVIKTDSPTTTDSATASKEEAPTDKGDDEDDTPGEEASRSSAVDPASNGSRMTVMLLSVGVAFAFLRK